MASGLKTLKEIAPLVSRVEVIHNPELIPQLLILKVIQDVATAVGVDVIAAGVHDGTESRRNRSRDRVRQEEQAG